MMPRRAAISISILGLATLVACRSSSSEHANVQAVRLPERVQGANLRPVGDPRRGYGSETARRTMERLRGLGVNTVSILLEGRMHDLEDPEIRIWTADREELAIAALEQANRLGLATVLVPHIYVDDGSWRGEIRLEDPALEEQWWESYADFIDAAASVAERGKASLLSVGVELKGLSSKGSTVRYMDRVVRRARDRFHGGLTYSANWDEADAVLFWHLVDFAGVNGFYPLTPDPIRGAQAVGRRLAHLTEVSRREVIVLEVGYRSSTGSHIKPWEWPEDVDAAVDLEAQATAWAAILSEWPSIPNVRGLEIWIVPTDPDDPASEPAHGFNPLNKPAEAVIRRAFSAAAGTAQL